MNKRCTIPEFKNVKQKHREVRHLSKTTQKVGQNQKINPDLPHSDLEMCEQVDYQHIP